MPIYTPGKLVLSRIQQYPAVIGEAFGGGYFAGYISHTANGSPTHALIVAPRATGAAGNGAGGDPEYPTGSLLWAANVNAPDGVNYNNSSVGGSFTGSITGTTMTVTAVSSGKIRPGHTITGTTVALGTIVVSQVSGTTNGIGDYAVSISQTVTSRTLTAGTSVFDGVANGTIFKDIDNTVGSGSTIFPAANFCESRTIGGFTDWYFPARFEMDIAYFNFKPGTQANSLSWGTNIYAVPRRNINNTTNWPRQTTVTSFTTTAERFIVDNHWASTENAGPPSRAWSLNYGNGEQGSGGGKDSSGRLRAFRRIALP